jgi:hypothetical protein
MGPLKSWFNQLEWIRDQNNSVACDRFRLGSFDEDIYAYLDRRIRPSRPDVTLAQYDYRSMWRDELAEIVARPSGDSIEYFGFTLDGPAAKNIFARQ